MAQTTPQGPEGLTQEDATKIILDIDDSKQPTQPKETPNFTSPIDPRILSLLTPLPSLPQITIVDYDSPSTTQTHYISQSALVTAHANLSDPFCTLLEIEKPSNQFTPTSPPSPSDLLASLIPTNTNRLTAKLTQGSLLVESSNFAATACWTPPWITISHPTTTPKSFTDTLHSEGREHFLSFITQLDALKTQFLHPSPQSKGKIKGHWELSLMARDPRREYIPGAVRAVVQPFLDAAERDGVAVWLEAGSARARDVYAHFGFVVVGEVGVSGLTAWCMMKT